MRSAFIFILWIFFSSLSCQSSREVQPKITPSTEASSFEQEDITQAVTEIQTLADQLNLNLNFKSFPVVVIVKDTLGRNAQAYCEFKSNGSGGQYIAIMKSTITEYQLLYKPHGQNSFLFMLLVHEFGHCFFGRSHSEHVVQNSNGELVPVTAMVTKSPNQLGMKVLSSTAKLFYLAEIAGIKTTQDFSISNF